MSYGPNFTKLLKYFIARAAIPPGGGFFDGVESIVNQERRKEVLKIAEKNTLTAIRLVKSAPDNPYGDDDEAIAADLVARIEARRREQKHRRTQL